MTSDYQVHDGHRVLWQLLNSAALSDGSANPTAETVVDGFPGPVGPAVSWGDVPEFAAPPAVIVVQDVSSGSGGGTRNGASIPEGWTSIGDGVALAHGICDPVTDGAVRAVVVFADATGSGPQTTLDQIEDLISSLRGRVFAIGLGRAAVLNPMALQALCDRNQGYMLMTGELVQDAAYRLMRHQQQVLAGVTNNEIVLDPVGFLRPGIEVRIPFWLAESDVTAKATLITPVPSGIRCRLETPDGQIVEPGVAAADPVLTFDGQHLGFYRIALPVPVGANVAHAGLWHARIGLDHRAFQEYVSTLDADPELHAVTMAHGARYNFNVHGYSNLRLAARLTQTTSAPGTTLGIRAVLTEYGMPAAARASCRVDVSMSENALATLDMPEVEPGVFEAAIQATDEGIYDFRVIAEGRTLRGRPFTREQSLTAAVWSS